MPIEIPANKKDFGLAELYQNNKGGNAALM